MNASSLLLALLSLAPAVAADSDPVVSAMTDELDRSKTLTLPGSPSPHYVAYHVFDAEGVGVVARFGALVSSDDFRTRQLSPTLRVGTNALDAPGFAGRMELLFAPWDDDYDALRHQLWMLSDDMYKTATERLRQEEASRKQTTRDDKDPDSFSGATTIQHLEPVTPARFDQAAFEEMAVGASSAFRSHPNIQTSWVTVSAANLRHRFVSSDGARVDEGDTIAEVEVFAGAQADDGTPIRRTESVLVLDLGRLPDAAAVRAMAERVAAATDQARTAPVADNYAGPILFEGLAAAQLMAYVLPQELTALPFAGEDGRLGRRVLPTDITVFDDPGLTEFGGKPLFGHYVVDYEGVAAQKVSLVDRGKQVGLLMGRTPNREVDATNGHARGTFPGMTMVSPGNLVVKSSAGKSDKALRAKLVQMLRKEGLEHGYVVTDLGGSPWSPADVLRIDAKGNTTPVRVDQMIMPQFSDLRRLVAAGNVPVVYNYLSAGGSPTGGLGGGAQEAVVPTSVVCPSLLFDQVEIKKSTGDKPKPPPYPHPFFAKSPS